MKRDDMIEAVRQAIWEVGAADDLTKLDAAGYTQAALTAIEEAGMVVVPKVPSEGMLWAVNDLDGVFTGKRTMRDVGKDIYTAMLAAHAGEG